MAEPDGSGANEEKEAGATIELSLRLDGDGRTTYDPALRPPRAASSSWLGTADDAERDSKRAKREIMSMDYSSKTTLANLAPPPGSSSEKALDDLLFDCEITDCGLLPRTFWVPAVGTEPRCYLEKLALEIFRHHVPSSSDDFFCDPETSGAEWWVQLRPSPPGTGRYSMLAGNDDDPDDDDLAKSGISFHWDKDEDLRLMCGGSMHIHPHLSTVTYLTDLGAPTMVLSKRIDPMTGQYMQGTESDGAASTVEGLVSWPRLGKHLSFDGRYLHAAPSNLMEEGLFERQCRYDVTSEMDEKAKKILDRKHRRVTFLVNIWLNYKPFNVKPFPETMISNLSKSNLFEASFFGRGKTSGSTEINSDETNDSFSTTKVTVSDDKASISACNGSNKCNAHDVKLTKMSWSMGQKDEESIEVLMPVEVIRSQGQTGSDVAITWAAGGVVLRDTCS